MSCRESRHRFSLDFVLAMDTRNGLPDRAREPQASGHCQHKREERFTSSDSLMMYHICRSQRAQGPNQMKVTGFRGELGRLEERKLAVRSPLLSRSDGSRTSHQLGWAAYAVRARIGPDRRPARRFLGLRSDGLYAACVASRRALGCANFSRLAAREFKWINNADAPGLGLRDKELLDSDMHFAQLLNSVSCIAKWLGTANPGFAFPGGACATVGVSGFVSGAASA
ncbi:hypothetical protein EJB05_27871 [Eragrostis curvula]|uniref:Uncharacterized protein n=1 Tax=Eragrostis curvula TaxID=38414 RepID=A0A5J9UQ83_9POAL|nr:hypothetical protein EJB05_27871 [Eragrostis curvula]